MPENPKKRRRDRQENSSGFSLIELVTVVAIVATLVVATRMIPWPKSKISEDWARFLSVHNTLSENAVLSGHVLGLRLTPSGFAAVRRTSSGWVETAPQENWTGPVPIASSPDHVGPLVFLPDGTRTPVSVEFETTHGRVICTCDSWERLSCTA